MIDRLYDVDGTVHVRIIKSDGGYHRTTIAPGVDPDLQMALVNAHLQSMGVDQVIPEDIGRVRARCAEVHTPERIAAFVAAQREREQRP